MTATVIRLRQRSDPAFRAMAWDMLALLIRDGERAALAKYRGRFESGSRRFRLQLALAVDDLIEGLEQAPVDEAGSPR